MSAKTWSMYALDTGVFTGVRFSSRDEGLLQANIPPGCGALEGIFNPARQRYDGQIGEVVAYTPGPPADDQWRTWAWSEEAGRWLEMPTPLALARNARMERDKRLAACDWVVLRAAEQGAAAPPGWLAYRMELRMLPEQPGFPTEIVWPVAPATA